MRRVNATIVMEAHEVGLVNSDCSIWFRDIFFF